MATIGHFQIVREIGRGGAGVVYLAEDVDIPGRRVALKRLRPEVAAADADVLRREAAVLAAIEHPHILVVHEVGVAPDGLYLVTEFMPEGSMANRIGRGPLTEAEALAAARQAASALAARSRALEAAAAGLRLDERTAETLASRLGAEPKR